MPDAAPRPDSWSDFWRLGGLTTLDFFRDGYTGELAEFWHALVDPLPAGSAVLDLATGNGAVALLVLRRARALQRRIAVEGLDAARIDPVAHAGRNPPLQADLAQIRFHPSTPVERTGLPTAHYRLVTSQYGIEYGDLRAALAEVARLLLPGGVFGAILHAADSDVARSAARVEALLDALLDVLDLPGRMRRVLAAVGDARDLAALTRARAAATDAWSALEQAVAQARAIDPHIDVVRGTTHGFLQRLLAPLGPALARPPAEKLALVDDLVKTSQGLRNRMGALRASALDRDGLERMLAWLDAAGLAPEPPRTILFGAQREPMGHGVVARRR